MLLSTGYITQGSQQNNQRRQNIKSQINAELATTLGGSVTSTSLANYANQLPTAISAAAVSSVDSFKKLMIIYMNIGAGLKELAPQLNHNEKRTKPEVDAQLMTALNGSVSFESLSNYASQLSVAIANLTESSTVDKFKAVIEMYINIGVALKQLAPKKQS